MKKIVFVLLTTFFSLTSVAAKAAIPVSLIGSTEILSKIVKERKIKFDQLKCNSKQTAVQPVNNGKHDHSLEKFTLLKRFQCLNLYQRGV